MFNLQNCDYTRRLVVVIFDGMVGSFIFHIRAVDFQYFSRGDFRTRDARRSLFDSPVYRTTRRVLFQTPRCAENRDNLIFEKVQGSSIGHTFEVNGAYEMDTEAESRGLVRVHVRVGG